MDREIDLPESASDTMTAPITYQSGFGNEHATEALPGVLPVGQNSPRRFRTGFMPSSCQVRHSRRRGMPTGAAGCTGFVQRLCTGRSVC